MVSVFQMALVSTTPEVTLTSHWAPGTSPVLHVDTGLLLIYSLVLRRRQWHPTPVLLPGKSHGQRSLVGCSPWGCTESDTTEQLHFHFTFSCAWDLCLKSLPPFVVTSHIFWYFRFCSPPAFLLYFQMNFLGFWLSFFNGLTIVFLPNNE